MRVSDMRTVLDLVEKYGDGSAEFWNSGAEHDMIFLNLPEEISDEDKKVLNDMRVLYDDSYGCWVMFT